MANELATTTEMSEAQIKALCMDYLKQTNSNLLPNEQAQFMAISCAFGLNPYKKEVYPIAYGQGNNRKLSIIVGYEVYLKRAESYKQYDGYVVEWEGNGADLRAKCTVYRKDRNHPTVSTVWLREYTQNNSMWNTKPHVMLEKVAIATALRRAFPVEMGGMPYIADELPDYMTGADKLEQQGYTEVPQDVARPQAPAKPKAAKKEIDEDTKQFMDGMKGLWTQAPEIYKSTMDALGFKSANNVPPERRGEVFNTIVANISKAAQQPKIAPTAMEQQDNGEVDNSLF